MKKLCYTGIILTLASAFLAPSVYAGGVLRDAKAPHLVHSNAHPINGRIPATHHFEVHVQGNNALSQLLIDLPKGIKVTRGIEITDQSDQKIDATVAINNRRAMITFVQPVPSGTTLSISLKGVMTPAYLTRIWLYPIYGRSVGINADIPIGLARIQTRK